MALEKKLKSGDSSLTSFNGEQPPKMVGSTDKSALHNEYSITGTPGIEKKPEPSILDLEGQTPADNYKDNLPTGASL